MLANGPAFFRSPPMFNPFRYLRRATQHTYEIHINVDGIAVYRVTWFRGAKYLDSLRAPEGPVKVRDWEIEVLDLRRIQAPRSDSGA